MTCSRCGKEFSEGAQQFCSPKCAGVKYDYSVHDYGFKPRPLFMGSGDYFLGVELETEGGDCSDAREVSSITNNLFYCKEDGSLDDGFEMVSHPGTLRYWHSIRPTLRKLTEYLLKLGIRSYDTKTCGMHIHVDKTAIEGNFHYLKLLNLLNREFALLISRRKPSRLDDWAAIPSLGVINNICRGNDDAETPRNICVNRNRHTYEFRLFRGTLKLDSIYKNLEFVHSAIEFTRQCTMEEAVPENYYKFIQQKNQYDHVRDYCEQQTNRAAQPEPAKVSVGS